jgi:hypothetical protein
MIPASPTGWTGLGGRAQFRSGSDDVLVEGEPEETLGESMASRIERKAPSCGRESVEKVPPLPLVGLTSTDACSAHSRVTELDRNSQSVEITY